MHFRFSSFPLYRALCLYIVLWLEEGYFPGNLHRVVFYVCGSYCGSYFRTLEVILVSDLKSKQTKKTVPNWCDD